MADVHSSPGTEPQDVSGGPPPIMTAQDLIDALTAAVPSPTILLQNREYKVDKPLVVPDGVTLEGVGEDAVRGGSPYRVQVGNSNDDHREGQSRRQPPHSGQRE
jgi:hypothetical protein